MEELTATIGSSTEAAQQANQLAGAAAQAAARGEQVVGHVVSSMQRITDNSRQISDIIGVIDGIAFQTNILALNAAVEAARAGEQGRGFAVVASEVRALAGRSAEAAKQIKALITTSVETVQTGSDQVAQAGKSMEEITHSVRRRVGSHRRNHRGLGGAARRHRPGEPGRGQLEQMTQQNASLVQESTSSAAVLSEQAQALNAAVSAFQITAAAQGMASPPPLAPARPAPLVAAPPKTTAASPRPGIAAAPQKALAKPRIAAAPAREIRICACAQRSRPGRLGKLLTVRRPALRKRGRTAGAPGPLSARHLEHGSGIQRLLPHVAALEMVVDQPHGLHEGIHGGGPDEAEAALLQVLG